jgi:hypothetical protein
MPFFFILPVWAFCVVIGVALLFFRDLRRFAYFVIALPTGATLSFALSTSVLLVVPPIAPGPHPQWFGIALIVGYVIALVLGAFDDAVGEKGEELARLYYLCQCTHGSSICSRAAF